MPTVFAGVGIHRQDRRNEQIITATGTADRLIIGPAVAGADIKQVRSRVIGHRVPSRSATAQLPILIAKPGRSRTAFENIVGCSAIMLPRLPRHDVEAPHQFASLGVVSRDETAHPQIGPTVSDDHLIVHDARRTGNSVRPRLVGRLGLPNDLAGCGIKSNQPPIESAHKDLAAPYGDAAIHRSAAGIHQRTVDFWIICPFEFTGTRVDRADGAPVGCDVEHPINCDGRRLLTHARRDIIGASKA